MCGIIGYVGKRAAAPLLLKGLRLLEYRGYDSAGISLLHDGTFKTVKKKGKIDEGLGRVAKAGRLQGLTGLGHTRWATHGPASNKNSHPHFDQSGKIAIVHNGVIENCDRIKRHLKGHVFRSSTDTEVLAHLIGVHYATMPANGCIRKNNSLTSAVIAALREIRGSYSILVMCSDYPETVVGARNGPPLLVGLGNDENFFASDAIAIAPHTREVIYMNDYDVITATGSALTLLNFQTGARRVQVSNLELESQAADRGDFPHFMLEEIFEQPRRVEAVIREYISQPGASVRFPRFNIPMRELRSVDRIVIVASGTSRHAALVGKHLLEDLQIPTEVDYAGEFRCRTAPLGEQTLVLVISQSGETGDTLASLRAAKRRGYKVFGICNVVGSSMAREADGCIFLQAGPEIGVASTKAFTTQVAVLALLALLIARLRTLSIHQRLQITRALQDIPRKIQSILQQNEAIKRIALKYAAARNFFFLGRRYGFPVALEGALKLKEISYIHAEAYPAAEMKHGPIALIDKETPTVFLIPQDSVYAKNLTSLQEIKARNGPIIAITSEGNSELARKVNDVIYLPSTLEPFSPLLQVIPLQLLAYHIAVARGCDADRPRNLAKSVTVE